MSHHDILKILIDFSIRYQIRKNDPQVFVICLQNFLFLIVWGTATLLPSTVVKIDPSSSCDD